MINNIVMGGFISLAIIMVIGAFIVGLVVGLVFMFRVAYEVNQSNVKEKEKYEIERNAYREMCEIIRSSNKSMIEDLAKHCLIEGKGVANLYEIGQWCKWAVKQMSKNEDVLKKIKDNIGVACADCPFGKTTLEEIESTMKEME